MGDNPVDTRPTTTDLEAELGHATGVILFDGNCPFCRNIVGLLMRLCREHKLLVCSIRSSRGSAAAAAIGGLPADTFAIVTRDGIDVGVAAYVKILSLDSRTSWLGRLVAAMPRATSDRVYKWVGNHRRFMSAVWGDRRGDAIPAERFVRRQ